MNAREARNRPGVDLFAALWQRLTWRHWREDRGSTLLLLALLSLGVAAFLAIRMANREAVAGFDRFNSSIQPRSDLVARSPGGRLPEERLRALRAAFGRAPVSLLPVLETTASPAAEVGARTDLLGDAPTALRVVGLDLVALGGRSDFELAGGETSFRLDEESPADAPRLWLTPAQARAWNLEAGETLELIFNTTTSTVTLAGLLPAATTAGETPPNLAVMDLPDLQAVAGLGGRVDRVEILLPENPLWNDALAEARASLAEADSWSLADPAEEAERGEEMTAAFRLNLTILSLIALLVALYLIVQALDAVVVRRRQEIAILRSLGMTPAMLRRLWLVEFAALGIAGSVGGLLLGWLLAQGTAGAVAKTVNALYFATSSEGLVLPTGGDVALAFLLGLGGSLLAGWLPLRDAAATPAAQVLAAGDFAPGFGLFRRPLPGLVLIAVGAGLWFLPPVELAGGARFPAAGYGAAFAWLVGGTLVVGALFGPLARGLRPFDGRFPSLRLARARLGDATSRHRLAAAGLYVAVAMAAAMSVLVGSFARTMEEWIEVRFQADVFLSSRAVSSMGQEFLLEPAVIEAIAARPEVAEVDPFRVLPIDLEGKRTYLGASRHDLLAGRQKVLWLDAPATELAEATPATPVAYVNEAFVARFGWGQGAMVEVPTPSGRETVRITGVFADYGNEQGLLWIDWPVFGAWFDSDAATNLSLFLTPGTDALVAAEALEASFPGLAARDNRTLRELVRRTFRQTFAITEALKVIGIAVAVGGLALALSNLLRESRRELRTLRTLGCTRREIARATAFESLGIACVGLGGGLLASIALGALLVFVINKQSFGWTLRWALPWHEFALLALGTAVMAMTVGYFVGRRQGRLLE